MNNGKIRIMHLNSYIGYDGPSRGILSQIKFTDKSRFDNIVCEIKSTRHEELVRDILRKGFEHVSLNSNRFYDASIILKMARCLKKNRIDILNTHNAVACWYGNVAAKIAGIPVVFTLRLDQRSNYRFLLKKGVLSEAAALLDRVTMKAADRIVAVSQRLEKKYIECEGIPEVKITTIRNAVDLEAVDRFMENHDREAVKRAMGIGPGVKVAGIVGDLVERKGHSCLIDAAKIVTEKNRDAAFLVVGDGPLRESLEERVRSHSLEKHFVFTGHVKDVFRYMSAMDIFVLPSFAEGISRALMEAMAMGLPAVCSDNDGNLEAVDYGVNGFIFPMNDHSALAEYLLMLTGDDDLRRGMGEQARNMAEARFDMRNLARKYEDLYLDLVNRRPIATRVKRA